MPTTKIKKISGPTKDIRAAALDMSNKEAEYLLRDFFKLLGVQLSTSGHVYILKKQNLDGPAAKYISLEAKAIRRHIIELLDIWTENFPTARWVKSIRGFGPIIAAGMTILVDIDKAPKISSLYRWAGLTPNSRRLSMKEAYKLIEEVSDALGDELTEEHLKWLARKLNKKEESFIKAAGGRNKEPSWELLLRALQWPEYNLLLKKVCNAIGDQVIKHKNLYHDLFHIRLAYERDKNNKGALKNEAKRYLARYSSAPSCYHEGYLTDAHLRARAKRWAVKVFLAHYYMVCYYMKYKETPPDIYSLGILQGKTRIHPPNQKELEQLIRENDKGQLKLVKEE